MKLILPFHYNYGFTVKWTTTFLIYMLYVRLRVSNCSTDSCEFFKEATAKMTQWIKVLDMQA